MSSDVNEEKNPNGKTETKQTEKEENRREEKERTSPDYKKHAEQRELKSLSLHGTVVFLLLTVMENLKIRVIRWDFGKRIGNGEI